MTTHSKTAQSQWQNLLSNQRLGSAKKATSESRARSAFHQDYDRLVFSHSFHKLNQKTQVHPLTNQLGIHTRLTHSLEVSCIGRSLAMMAAEKLQDAMPSGLPIGVNASDFGVVVQAACLAHDIGNPPFGHAGEFAIRDWFSHPDRQAVLNRLSAHEQLDLLAYEGNAQGFRLLTKNEHHPDKGGMRLTCATLGAFMKYPWQSKDVNPSYLNKNAVNKDNINSPKQSLPKLNKFGSFQSESAQLAALAEALNLPKSDQHGGFCRHPLAYLLEAADDICYALIDLEDGVHLQMLSVPEVSSILYELIGETPAPVPEDASIRQHLAMLRARAMMSLVSGITDVFVRHNDDLLAGNLSGSLFDYCENRLQQGIHQAKHLAQSQIFNHPSKVRLELMANQCLTALLDAFLPLAWEHNCELSFEKQRLLLLLSPHFAEHRRPLTDDIYQNILNILDFITGMNDHEAYYLAQELQGKIAPMI